jgi:shikimate dehydrogenase
MAVPYAEVIGDPIGHSKSPAIHRFWLEKLSLGYDFRATPVSPDQMGDYLSRRRHDPQWCGCSVTFPLKQGILPLLDRSAGPTAMLGAANCVTRDGNARLTGHNTDWLGFLEPLQPWLDLDRTYRMAQVIGAGGAAAAVSYALDRCGFTIVSISRDPQKALALRRRLELFDDDLVAGFSALEGSAEWGGREEVLDLLVNATPLGMKGFPHLPVSLAILPPAAIVYDLVYHPLETALLRAAREAGMVAIDGLSMLIGQAAEAFELFFAQPAPRGHDAELRELLTR